MTRQGNKGMGIRRHVGVIAVSQALCFATTILSSAAARCAEQQGGLAIPELTCEYAINPLGVDTPRPRFGWLLASAKRSQLQSAYRVLVATSEKQLHANVGNKWDSGKVNSDRSVNVEYRGKPLSGTNRASHRRGAGRAPSKWGSWNQATGRANGLGSRHPARLPSIWMLQSRAAAMSHCLQDRPHPLCRVMRRLTQSMTASN